MIYQRSCLCAGGKWSRWESL